MRQKYEMINSLIEKNEHFYKIKLISKCEYLRNNIILAEKLENLLIDMSQKTIVKEFLKDQISIVKFNLAVSSLSIVDN